MTPHSSFLSFQFILPTCLVSGYGNQLWELNCGTFSLFSHSGYGNQYWEWYLLRNGTCQGSWHLCLSKNGISIGNKCVLWLMVPLPAMLAVLELWCLLRLMATLLVKNMCSYYPFLDCSCYSWEQEFIWENDTKNHLKG